jgi:hypothetical protein
MAMTAASSTVEALMFGLRTVVLRLQNFMPHIAKAWTANEIAVLIATRNNALGRTGAVPALPKE